MREIRINKVTINIGCKEPGERLEKAKILLERITGKKAVITHARKRSTFGVAKGRPLGCKVTLRGKDAIEFLKKALDAINFTIPKKSFDTQGNFSFGIEEYINLPKVKYDPEIGMYGMDVCVTLERPGYRVSRKRLPRKIGKNHKITREDAIKWAEKFGIKII
ncbi:MAG: 50S ribosomal protein L5 [Candidatus Aenigmatarchaeota archaeon]|nr:50S ribosomal protein L5 [Candidatus Aenigmarchaeota archaeon]